jgi:hypothetical protein
MGKRIYPLQSIKYWYCYDVEEVANLSRTHNRTVQNWIKDGLPTVDAVKPSLVYGHELKSFLGKMNEANKCKTAFGEMFCKKCKEARTPFKKRIELTQVNQIVRAKARCRTCKSIMNKTYKLDAIPRLRSSFEVGDVLELYDCETSPLNTHFLDQDTSHPNVPIQGELF